MANIKDLSTAEYCPYFRVPMDIREMLSTQVNKEDERIHAIEWKPDELPKMTPSKTDWARRWMRQFGREIISITRP